MITGIEVYMFTLMCELQIEKHRYDKKHNCHYNFDYDVWWKNKSKLEKQKCNVVSAYMLQL